MKTFLGVDGVKSDLKIAAEPVILFGLSGSTFPDSSFSRKAQIIDRYQLQENIQRSLATFQDSFLIYRTLLNTF